MADTTGLRAGSVRLPEVLFQSITFMAPGIGIAFAIGIGIPLAGANLPLSLIIALVACSLTALANGQLASRIPSAGGLYSYARAAIGWRAGFTVGWYYLAVIFALTYFDVKLSVRTAMVLGGIEMLVFIALGLTIVGHGPNSATPFNPSASPDGASEIAQGAVYAVLAFIGFEAAASFGEEAKNPRRAVPLSIIASCVGVGLFYLFLSYAWNVGADSNIVAFHQAHGGNDWPAFAQRFWGGPGAWIVFLALLNSIIAAGASSAPPSPSWPSWCT